MREISLTADTAKPESSPTPTPTSTPFEAYAAIIVIIVLCAVICALALSVAIYCFRRGSAAVQLESSNHEPRPKQADQSAPATLSAASPVAFSDGMELAGSMAECAICLTEFVDGDKIRVMEECRHGFHVDCIERWLCSHSSCPTCRRNCLGALPEQDNPPTSSTTEFEPGGNFLVLSTPL